MHAKIETTRPILHAMRGRAAAATRLWAFAVIGMRILYGNQKRDQMSRSACQVEATVLHRFQSWITAAE
jgi:hypothetical protein